MYKRHGVAQDAVVHTSSHTPHEMMLQHHMLSVHGPPLGVASRPSGGSSNPLTQPSGIARSNCYSMHFNSDICQCRRKALIRLHKTGDPGFFPYTHVGKQTT